MKISVLALLHLFECCRLGLAGILNLSAADQQAAVDAHNKYRIDAKATAMQKLKWNDALAQFAQNTVAQCNFEHTPYAARQNVGGFPYIGENIYTISRAAEQPTLQTAIDNWASEQEYFNVYTNECSGVCGHYTQYEVRQLCQPYIVWSETTDVGCAIAQCDTVQGFSADPGYLIFCNYGPGGNMIGEAPYEKASDGEIGSKCQQSYNKSADSNGLCDSAATADNPPSANENGSQATTDYTMTETSDCISKWDCDYICQEGDSALAAVNNYENCSWDCGWKCQ